MRVRIPWILIAAVALLGVGCASLPATNASPQAGPTEAYPTDVLGLDPSLKQQLSSGMVRWLGSGDPDCVPLQNPDDRTVCMHRVIHEYWTEHRGAICLGRPLHPTIIARCICGATEFIQYFEHMVAQSGISGAAVFAIETDESQRRHQKLGGHDHSGDAPLKSCYCAPPTKLGPGGICLPE